MASDAPLTCNCAALRRAARHATRMYDEALAPVGLGVNQFSILARIDRHGPCNLNELAGRLVMDRSTLGHLLRPLQTRGLLTLEALSRDKRQRLIALTATGRVLLQEAQPYWGMAQARFEAAFGAGDALQLRNTLDRVAATSFADDGNESKALSQ